VVVTVCVTVEITVEMLVTVEVVVAVIVRVTVEQIRLIKVGDPPAPVEMPPTKSTARAAANMSLRIMFCLLSGEADASRTRYANHCRDGDRSEVSVDSCCAAQVRSAQIA
jgi:hypothetical protein